MAEFSSKTITFFRQLSRNNDRDWFIAHKGAYEEQVKAPMLELVEGINRDLAKFAVDHVSNPKRALYRIHRDTRFSKDKTPYKSHQAAMFGHARLPKNYCAGFYFSISHTEIEIAGGLYMPEPDQLMAVRQELIARTAAWKKLVSDRSLLRLMGPLQGARLARPPKGYDAGHPSIEWVQMKQFYFGTTLEPAMITAPSLRREIARRFQAMTPVVNFLNSAIIAALPREEESDPGPRRPAPMF